MESALAKLRDRVPILETGVIIKWAFLVIVVLQATPILAQGQRCEGFTFNLPGYSCSIWQADASGSDWAVFDGRSGGTPPAGGEVFDNEGRLVRIRNTNISTPCDGSSDRNEIIVFDGSTEQIIGSIVDQCDGSTKLSVRPQSPLDDVWYSLKFDPINGRLLIPLRSYYGTESFFWVAAIDGFATTFDILQTFIPAADQISFRVPYMPEGFQYADWFDTYYGDLATAGDWSQARPLQCGYPAAPPDAGDFLAVEDTLPTPAPGSGYYYVTAVNYQGQTRYGRKSIGGILSGRDPAVLPACQ